MKTASEIIELSPDSQLRIFPRMLSPDEASLYYDQLRMYLNWQQERIKIFGKVHDQPRLTAWFEQGLSAYSNYKCEIASQPWPSNLLPIKLKVEKLSGTRFNSALANFYRNGRDYMGFHSDDELILGLNPLIASLSLGAERRFVVKGKTDKKTVLDLTLGNGSLIIMSGRFQHEFKHGVPKSLRCTEGRINLTFRKLKPDDRIIQS